MADKITKRRLEWLGHIARMPEHRIPKMALFGCVRACVRACVCVCACAWGGGGGGQAIWEGEEWLKAKVQRSGLG